MSKHTVVSPKERRTPFCSQRALDLLGDLSFFLIWNASLALRVSHVGSRFLSRSVHVKREHNVGVRREALE